MSDQQTLQDADDIRAELVSFQEEHRTLDTEICDIMSSGAPIDLFHVQKLKKKKLWLKDVIQQLKSSLIDDIIA